LNSMLPHNISCLCPINVHMRTSKILENFKTFGRHKSNTWSCFSFTDMWPKFAFLGLMIIRLMVSANPDAKRLYDDLLSSYNKLVRPVVNTSDVLRVSIKLKLSQLIDVVRTQNNVIWLKYSTYPLIIVKLVWILTDKLTIPMVIYFIFLVN